MTQTLRLPSLILIFVITAAVLLLRINNFYPYIADDAFISMRYAQRFLEGKGLTWNDGEYVEGYSNLLWVLSTAVLGKLGMDLEMAVRLLGITCTLATPTAFYWYARRNQMSLVTLGAASMVYATLPPIAVWAIGGLEAPMVMLCMAWAAALLHSLLHSEHKRYAIIAGILLGLICLLRPEGPIYTVTLMLPMLICSSHAWNIRLRIMAIICAISATFFFAQTGFRLWYYDALFANSMQAKVAFTAGRLQTGLAYVVLSSLFFIIPWIYALLGNLHARKQSHNPTAVWSQWPLLLPITAIIIAGGDIFPGGRALVPLLPLIVFAFMDAAHHNLRLEKRSKETLFLIYVVAAHIGLLTSVEFDEKSNKPYREDWVQDAIHIGKTLKQEVGDKHPLVAVYAAGAIAYYSELPTLDVLGLNDRNITSKRKASENFGQGLMGHELFDGEYINSKKPDILAFHTPGIGIVCESFQMQGCDKLMPHYRKRSITIPGHDVSIWIRNDSKLLQHYKP
jgi:arabinofuranosyltransferase